MPSAPLAAPRRAVDRVDAPRVVHVAPGSPAERAGLEPGDELVLVAGEAPRDIVAYRLLTDAAEVDLEVRRGGVERFVRVEKREGEPLGAEVHSAVFDRIVTCDNHCPFCFIHQLPTGMRKSLSLKDDDYRLSFLYGNFTTLTRFTEADLERVVTEGLSPLHVSIHATDPHVRTTLLRNKRGATSLRWLRALLDAGVTVHGQVVVCPGVNDGDVLDDTLLGVLDRFPELASVGVVPLGVSGHNREASMRPHTVAEAVDVVERVDAWQARYRAALGRRLAWVSDEYLLMAGVPVPELDHYEGVPQHENGVGMIATLRHEVRAALAGETVAGTSVEAGFFSWVDAAPTAPTTGCHGSVDGAPADGYRAPRVESTGSGATPIALRRRPPRQRPVTILTGGFGAEALRPLVPELSDAAGVPITVRAVTNRFFGGTIAVTGLLTGADLADALVTIDPEDRVLLPDVTLSRGAFLDGTTPGDLPRPVEVVRTDGVALVSALVGDRAGVR
jgi:putative radical SAM enzyme (TIGR03279 family)